MTTKKTSRRVQPENWEAIHAYGKALERFAKSRDPNEFTELHIPHEDMAKALIAIALGADAREVFRQNADPHRQSIALFNRTRAFVYWEARIKGATPADARRAAQNHFPDLPALSDTSITRLANQYRDEALNRYEQAGCDLSEIKAQLSSRSKQGKFID